MLSDRQIGDLKLELPTFGHATSFRSDCDVLVDLPLPDEVEVELSIVLDDDLLGLPLVDEEFTKVKLMWLTWLHLHAA